MKRNKVSTRTMRRRRTGAQEPGNSRYALKVARGRQMYGNGTRPGKGCCANSHLFGALK